MLRHLQGCSQAWTIELDDQAPHRLRALIIEPSPEQKLRLPIAVGTADLFEPGEGPAKLKAGLEISVPLLDARLLAMKLVQDGDKVTAKLAGSLLRDPLSRLPLKSDANGWPTFAGAQGDIALTFADGSHTLRLAKETGASIAVLPQQLQLELSGGFELLVVFKQNQFELVAHPVGNDRTIKLGLDLFVREAGLAGEIIDMAVGYELPAQQRLIEVALTWPGQGDVTLFVSPRISADDWRPSISLASLQGWTPGALAKRIAGLPFLGGTLLRARSLDPGAAADELGFPFNVELDTNAATLRIDAGQLVLEKLAATIKIGNDWRLDLTGGALVIDEHMTVKKIDVDGESRAEIELELTNDLWIFDRDYLPISFELLGGTRFAVSLDAGRPHLRLVRGDSRPAAMAYVPGVAATHQVDNRFAFSVWSDGAKEPTAEAVLGGRPVHCRFTPAGAELIATLDRRKVNFADGGTDVLPGAATVEGTIAVQAGAYVIAASGTAQLPWLSGASGTLKIVGASRANPGEKSLSLGVRFDVQLDQPWTDPSGVLSVEHPGAWVSIEWSKRAGGFSWYVDGGVSGKLVFRPPAGGFGEGAGAWLHKLFDSVAIDFDRLSLRRLGTPSELVNGIALQLRLAEPIHVDFWELLQLSLDSITLRAGGISVGGDLGFELGPLSFRGRLPGMRIGLDHGSVSLGIDGIGASFSVQGALALPSGLSASMDVSRIRTAEEESLFGAGSLTIPGLPGVRIAANLGRWRPKTKQGDYDSWRPLFMLYLEADIPVVVFPGIVLRQEGIGFGIDKQLAGFGELIEDPKRGIEKLTDGSEGIPDPGALDGWENAKDTRMVALRSRVAPSQAPPDTMQPYVLDIVLGLRDDFSLVVFASGWLFAKLDSTRIPEFRRHPVVKGIVGLFPRQRLLEARFVTCKNPKSDFDVPLLTQLLDMVQAQVSLVASPDLFQLQLGPITGDAEFLGLSVHANALFLVHVGKGRAVAMSRVSLNAAFHAGVGFSLGPLSVRVALAARFAFECTYLGGVDEKLGILLYGDTRISAAASLQVEMDLHIHIHIDLFFGDIDIDIHIHFAASLSIVFDASVQAVISTQGAGLAGSGAIAIELFGFRLGFRVPFELGSTGALGRARGLADQLALEA